MEYLYLWSDYWRDWESRGTQEFNKLSPINQYIIWFFNNFVTDFVLKAGLLPEIMKTQVIYDRFYGYIIWGLSVTFAIQNEIKNEKIEDERRRKKKKKSNVKNRGFRRLSRRNG